MKIQLKDVKDIIMQYINDVDCTGLYCAKTGCTCSKDNDMFYCLLANNTKHAENILNCIPAKTEK